MDVCPPVCWSGIPSWLIPGPEVNLQALSKNGKKNSADIVKIAYSRMEQLWNGYLQIHTEGSKVI